MKVIDEDKLIKALHSSCEGDDPYDLYAAMFYGPANQNASKAFRLTFPKWSGNSSEEFIRMFHSSIPAMKALKVKADNIIECISPQVLAMHLYKMVNDEDEQSNNKIKAIGEMAKLLKYYSETSININIQEIELIIPDFEQDEKPELSFDNNVIDMIDFEEDDGEQ